MKRQGKNAGHAGQCGPCGLARTLKNAGRRGVVCKHTPAVARIFARTHLWCFRKKLVARISAVKEKVYANSIQCRQVLLWTAAGADV